MTMQNGTPGATLADFFAAVRADNPFLVNRVDRAIDPRWVNVEAIHEAAFKKIVALGEQAQRDNRGIGVTVWGEAGVGKSHLLTRLGRWAQAGQKAAYVYLHNLQASPERLPRYVLRSVLSVLTTAGAGRTEQMALFRLLNIALKAAVVREGKARPTWEQVTAIYRGLVNDLAGCDPSGGVLFDRTAYEVLLRFFCASHPSRETHDDALTALAIRWLSGDTLEEPEAQQLGLSGSAGVAVADNQHIKQVLVALTQVARAAGQLVLLGFDQVDNIEESQVKALSRFLHDLLDSAGNLLIVTTGVQNTLVGYKQRGVITETSWDRLGQFEIRLGRLRREQGQALLRARLQPFLAPFRGVPEVEEHLRGDPLFPLSSWWFDQRLRDLPDFRPRDLIGWACDRWQQLQEQLQAAPGEELLQRWADAGTSTLADTVTEPPVLSATELQAALDQAVTQKMAEHKTRCLRDPSPLTVDEDHLVGLLDASLRQCLGPGRAYLLQDYHRDPKPASGPQGPYHLTLEQRLAADAQLSRIRVCVLIRENATSATAVLRHLPADQAPSQRVLLVTVRDRLPLGQKGTNLLEQLRQRGPERFRHLEISLAEYAELDALQAVVLQAGAGDFEFAPAQGQRRAATEEDVVASHHRAGRYLAQPLLRELLGGEVAANPVADGVVRGKSGSPA
ncbi:MAG TPA: ATP-binding protein [Gemmataceae bacterium]|nr:ATP-binding protein [Gemmataceae bacterium]